MYHLKTERLEVALADPAEVNRLTTRFDHTGFVNEVILDKTVHFCASEPRNMKSPSSGGRGLCSEFCFDPSPEAAIGGLFPKFGVGLLKKEDDGEYCFYKKYECTPFKHVVEKIGQTEIIFRTLPSPCMGYAAQSVRKVTAEENRITMEIQMSNVGERTFEVREYCHNFLSIDGMALGPDYSLTLPAGLHMDRQFFGNGPEPFDIIGNIVRPRRACFTPASFRLQTGDFFDKMPFFWRIHHDGANVTVEGMDFFRPYEVKIWANDHMLCPEVFFCRSLEPGQSCEWKRQWSFYQVPR